MFSNSTNRHRRGFINLKTDNMEKEKIMKNKKMADDEPLSKGKIIEKMGLVDGTSRMINSNASFQKAFCRGYFALR